MTTPPTRLRVIHRDIIENALDHPARQRPWSVREMGEALGVHFTVISKLRTGERDTLDAAVARQFAELVGYHMNCLFMPAVSTKVNTEATS
jgi:hypothetical protein